MTHPPSPEAKRTPLDLQRALQCYRACQSIPGDPEMALRLAREAINAALHDRPSAHTDEIWCRLNEAAKALGYDGDSK